MAGISWFMEGPVRIFCHQGVAVLDWAMADITNQQVKRKLAERL